MWTKFLSNMLVGSSKGNILKTKKMCYHKMWKKTASKFCPKNFEGPQHFPRVLRWKFRVVGKFSTFWPECNKTVLRTFLFKVWLKSFRYKVKLLLRLLHNACGRNMMSYSLKDMKNINLTLKVIFCMIYVQIEN